MAVWQYDLFLVGEGNPLPLLMDDGWELPQLPAASTLNAQGTLTGPMGYPWLMMDDWVVFGNEEGTRIDLMFNEAGVVHTRHKAVQGRRHTRWFFAQQQTHDGVEAGPARSGRGNRSAATRHAELDHVRPYLQVSQKRLEEMFTNVL